METEDKKAYITYLSDSYEKVSKEFFKNNDFHTSKLKNSINLFTKESLEERIPKPKRLEVYALLSGVSFEQSLKSKLSKIQIEINNIIKENLKYFVLPDNLGLEHCVFKWPNDQDLTKNMLNLSKKIFNEIVARHKAFSIEVKVFK